MDAIEYENLQHILEQQKQLEELRSLHSTDTQEMIGLMREMVSHIEALRQDLNLTQAYIKRLSDRMRA